MSVRLGPELSLMFKTLVLGTFVLGLLSVPCMAAQQPEDFAGTWDLALDKSATNCRLLLRPQKSDAGDYFLGFSGACRHSMPAFARLGRWSMPDAQHLTLADPDGTTLLAFTGAKDMFTATSQEGSFTLKALALTGRSAAFAPVEAEPSDSVFAPVELVTTRHRRAAETAEPVGDVAGRYAVMREKRDTGCMLTLDTERVAGGDRAQLAPGCRDQGIVIFDPAAWQIVKGELVLTARAGHKAILGKDGDGAWKKDPTEGKPLGLKKL